MVAIGQLRNWRARPDRAVAIGSLIEAKRVEVERVRKRLGSFVELWETVLPDELAAHTRVTAIRGGVVHVTVDTSATAYELDRRLREGLEQQMRRAYGKTFVRVKVKVESSSR